MAEPISCPKCESPLDANMIAEGIVVFSCPSCNGALYEAEDLAVPLKLGPAKPAKCECPRCRKPMARP